MLGRWKAASLRSFSVHLFSPALHVLQVVAKVLLGLWKAACAFFAQCLSEPSLPCRYQALDQEHPGVESMQIGEESLESQRKLPVCMTANIYN